MRFVTAAGLLIASLSLPALAQSGPNPNEVYIRNFSYSGTGCPAGSVGSNLSTDAKTLTLAFDGYVAEILPTDAAKISRKNCQLIIDIQYPQGWTFAVTKVDYRGYVFVDPNVVAEQTANYYFSGVSTNRNFSSKIGPFPHRHEQSYLFTDEVPTPSMVYAPCGNPRALNINSQVKVDKTRNASGYGIITTDSTDVTVNQHYRFSWQRCGTQTPSNIYLDSKVFNWQAYLDANPDLRPAGINTQGQAESHWLNHGLKECRWGGAPNFVASRYLANYPDLRAAYGNNCELATKHYIEFGFNEGRRGN